MGQNVKRAALTRVGRLDLIDLQALCDSYGREFLPHPFAHLRSSPFACYHEYAAHRTAVRDRLSEGDLSELNPWFSSYLDADIRVECVVSTVGAPRGRLLAHRRGQLGFIAAQRPDEHLIEVYTVLPYELGPAIAGALTLTQPGKHARIAIPHFLRRAASSPGDDEDVRVQYRDLDSEAVSVAPAQVTRCTRVQSHWKPARDWGFDHTKNAVVWVTTKDDGDYIYTPNFEFLTPMTARGLTVRIDELIAQDIDQARQSQGD